MKCKNCGKAMVGGSCPGCSKQSMSQMMGMKPSSSPKGKPMMQGKAGMKRGKSC